MLGCEPHDKGQPMNSYDEYVKDEKFLTFYNDYQKRYASEIAERDKAMLRLIAEKTSGNGTLLDIGCSTGNLLLHIKRAFPGMKLTGGELAESSLTAARASTIASRQTRSQFISNGTNTSRPYNPLLTPSRLAVSTWHSNGYILTIRSFASSRSASRILMVSNTGIGPTVAFREFFTTLEWRISIFDRSSCRSIFPNRRTNRVIR
jgi:SAM-dependent methyltransferase